MADPIGVATPQLAPLRSPQHPQWDAGGGYNAAALALPAARKNSYFGGNGQIVATVKKHATLAPLRRRVQLYSCNTNALVDETWSDAATGSYRFELLDRAQKYFVCSFDHTGADKGVIADQLTPEAMP
jgi:hypothetical protein